MTEQPPIIEFHLADDVFVKTMYLKEADSLVPQHSHEYDHHSFLARGSIAAWCEEEFLGNYVAPCALFIKAHKKHTFRSLEPDVLIYCIHNVSRTGEVDIHEVHEFRESVLG